MELLKRRYFVVLSLIFIAFTTVFLRGGANYFLYIFAFVVVAGYFACKKLFKRVKFTGIMAVLLICAAIFGFARVRVMQNHNAHLTEKYSGMHTVTGYVVESSSRYPYMSEHVVVIESVDGEKTDFSAILYAEFDTELSRGDFFECETEIKALSSVSDELFLKNSNPDEYPLICHIRKSENLRAVDGGFRVTNCLSSLNLKLSARLKALLNTANGSLASALLLGNRELLSDSVLRDFKRAGVYHMLALSGMHVAILIGLVDALLKKLLVKRGVRIGVLTLLTLFYVALTGFQLSACRAMLMLFVVYASQILRLRSDTLTSLFAAASVIILISPASASDLGFQLSFLSTLGVIVSTMITRKIRWRQMDKSEFPLLRWASGLLLRCVELSIVSLCVFILTLPLVAKYFGEVSLATFVSNLFMGVICEIFMIFSLFTLAFWRLSAIVSVIAPITSFFGGALTGITALISNADNIVVSLRYPNTDLIVWISFAAFVLLICVRVGRKWLLSLPFISLALLLCLNIGAYRLANEDNVSVEFYASDILVISSVDGVYICDSSNGRYGALYDATELARNNGFTEIDGVILSHYHSTHVVSLYKLASSVKLDSVYLPRPQNSKETLTMTSIVQWLENMNVGIYVFDAYESLDLFGGELVVSERAYTENKARPSLALSYRRGNSSLILLEGNFFETPLCKDKRIVQLLSESDVTIFGTDANEHKGSFDAFEYLSEGSEVVFCNRKTMLLSDAEPYLSDFTVYVDTKYKKYDFK